MAAITTRETTQLVKLSRKGTASFAIEKYAIVNATGEKTDIVHSVVDLLCCVASLLSTDKLRVSCIHLD